MFNPTQFVNAGATALQKSMALTPQQQFSGLPKDQQKALYNQQQAKAPIIRASTQPEVDTVRRNQLMDQISEAKSRGLNNEAIKQMVFDRAPEWAKHSIVSALSYHDQQEANKPGYFGGIIEAGKQGYQQAQQNQSEAQKAFDAGTTDQANPSSFGGQLIHGVLSLGLPIAGAVGAAISPIASPVLSGIQNVTSQPFSTQGTPETRKQHELSIGNAITSTGASSDTQRKLRSLIDIGVALTALDSLTGIPKLAKAGTNAAVKTGEFAKNQLGKTGKILSGARSNIAEDIITRNNKLTVPQQLDFKQRTGTNPSTWLKERGIIDKGEGTVGKLIERFNTLKTSEDAALAQVPGKFSDASVTKVIHELRDFYKNTENPALGNIQKMIQKSESEGLTMPEIIDAKRQYERNVRLGYLRENNSVKVALATNRDTALRKFAYNEAKQAGFTNLPDIAKEIQASRNLADKLGRKYAPGMPSKLDLMYHLLAVSGTINPEAWGLLIGKNLISKLNISSGLAKILNPSKAKTFEPPAVMLPQRKLLSSPSSDAFRSQMESTAPINLPRVSQSTVDSASNIQRPGTTNQNPSYVTELLKKLENQNKIPITVKKSAPKRGRPSAQKRTIFYGAPTSKLGGKNTLDIQRGLFKKIGILKNR